MIKMQGLVLASGMLLALLGGCGGSDSGGSQLCNPGDTRECVGPGSCRGAQACAPDGMSWSECDCGSNEGAGGESGDSSDAAAGESGSGAIETSSGGTGSGGEPGSGGAGTGGPGGGAGAAVTPVAGNGGAVSAGGASGSSGSSNTAGAQQGLGGVAGTLSTAGTAGLAGGAAVAGAAGLAATGGETGTARGGSAGAAGGTGDACLVGPNGTCWFTYADANSLATWVDSPSSTAAHVQLDAATYENAGMGFTFNAAGDPVDLSGYDELIFNADVAVGQDFHAGLSAADGAWCTWNLVGLGDSEYTIDLSSPNLCGPSACGFDLQVTSVSFGVWGSSDGVNAEVLVSNVEFRTTGSGAGAAKAGDAGIGPGGRCWSTFVYDGTGNADWVDLTTSVAHVYTAVASNAQAGMMAEWLAEEQDLSGYQAIEFDADISGASVFEVLLSGRSSWCWWNLSASGLQTYSIDLTSPGGCDGADAAAFSTLTEVETIEFKNNGQLELEMAVTEVRLVP